MGRTGRRDRTRGQLSLSVVEAGVGVVFVLAVAMGFAYGVPAADTESPQLDAYASDAATVLANEPPRHAGETRLAEVTSSRAVYNPRALRDRKSGRPDLDIIENQADGITPGTEPTEAEAGADDD